MRTQVSEGRVINASAPLPGWLELGAQRAGGRGAKKKKKQQQEQQQLDGNGDGDLDEVGAAYNEL